MNPGLYAEGELGLAETPSPLDGADFLRSVLNSLAIGVAVCDRQGKLLYFNSEAERILGVELRAVGPEEWTPTYGCFLPDTVTPYPPGQLPMARCLGGEEVLHELVYIRNPQRMQGVWITVSARPFRDRAGAIAGAVAKIQQALGPITILVNNAGESHSDPVARLSYDTWQRMLAVNLTGTFLCSQEALRLTKHAYEAGADPAPDHASASRSLFIIATIASSSASRAPAASHTWLAHARTPSWWTTTPTSAK